MFELFAALSFWAWLFIAIEIVLLFVLVETDQGVGAGISILIFAALLNWVGGVPVFATIWANPLWVFALLGIYLVVGTGWAISKWYIHVKKIARKYREIKDEFMSDRGLEKGHPLDDKQRLELRSRTQAQGLREVPPKANKNKSRITGWMMFWPVSMIWSVLDDFVKELFFQIYDYIGGFLQRISDRVFKDIVDDFKE